VFESIKQLPKEFKDNLMSTLLDKLDTAHQNDTPQDQPPVHTTPATYGLKQPSTSHIQPKNENRASLTLNTDTNARIHTSPSNQATSAINVDKSSDTNKPFVRNDLSKAIPQSVNFKHANLNDRLKPTEEERT
jgi:hypothetical protein